MSATSGPWTWQRFGTEWCLVGNHGMRPIVLSARVHGLMKDRGLTSLDSERGLLKPFDPQHPDAILIASAPEQQAKIEALADALERLLAMLANDTIKIECAYKEDAEIFHERESAARAALRLAGRL